MERAGELRMASEPVRRSREAAKVEATDGMPRRGRNDAGETAVGQILHSERKQTWQKRNLIVQSRT
jgi:hypothetical protein